MAPRDIKTLQNAEQTNWVTSRRSWCCGF